MIKKLDMTKNVASDDEAVNKTAKLTKNCTHSKCNKSSTVAEMSDRLTTTDIGRKVGGGCCAPFRGGGTTWVPI